MYIYDSFATGVGAAWLAMVNSLLQSLVFRLPSASLLERGLGLGRLGLYWAECLSPIVPAVIGGVFFLQRLLAPPSASSPAEHPHSVVPMGKRSPASDDAGLFAVFQWTRRCFFRRGAGCDRLVMLKDLEVVLVLEHGLRRRKTAVMTGRARWR